VWQALRDELRAARAAGTGSTGSTGSTDGVPFEIVTVGIDAAGADALRPFTDAAPGLTHLVDTTHRVAELFGVINIPNGVWIDEHGMIVRPAEPAPALRPAPPPPPPSDASADAPAPAAAPAPGGRMAEVMAQAMQIRSSPREYDAALRDWAGRGGASPYALPPGAVIERSTPRSADVARGEAHFELACHLVGLGRGDAAVPHFRAAHRLHPENFSYRRQAWSLVPGVDGPLARFWQGPVPGHEDEWPYEGDWLSDVTEMGAANYYPAWTP
jgi:hypothetical protein